MDSAEDRIRARMKAARKQAGLSQDEMGRLLGVSYRTYRRWETQGGYGLLNHLSDIARVLGLRESDLLGDDRRPQHATFHDIATKLDQVIDEVRSLRDDLDGLR